MTLIRRCTLQDMAGLLALYRELRPHDPALAPDAARTALTATCQLGVIATLTNGGRPFGMVEHVVTASAFRRRGISRQLLTHALELAWQQDCYKVMLLSGEGRDEAHRLYEKLGFKAGIEKGFVLKQVDAMTTTGQAPNNQAIE